MKFGYVPTEGVAEFEGVLEEARLAERVGFDGCMTTEHHQSDHYWPAPLVRLSAVAAATDDLDLVPGIVVLPLRNALELAQKTAMLDRISDGRVILGTALGYVPEEFAGYGVSMDDRGGRLIEGLEVLDRYLAADGPFSFDGEYYSIDDWKPVPAPVQEPRPPLWLGGWGDLALRRSVQYADAWLPGVTAGLDDLLEREGKLEAHAERYGRDWDDLAHPLQREIVVAETEERAWELAEEHLYASYRDEYGTDEWSHPLVSPAVAADFEALAEDRFLIGTPEQVAEGIERFDERLAIDYVFLRFHHPGMSPEHTREGIELFGDEVIPAL